MEIIYPSLSFICIVGGLVQMILSIEKNEPYTIWIWYVYCFMGITGNFMVLEINT